MITSFSKGMEKGENVFADSESWINRAIHYTYSL